MPKTYKITLLPGDGIGPEIIAVAIAMLKAIEPKFDLSFEFKTALAGGAAIDATGHPLPEETLKLCQASDAVLLAAVGGDKWDTLPSHLRPEQALTWVYAVAWGCLPTYARRRFCPS
jgi:3-isopropylmalate dehydrogenase